MNILLHILAVPAGLIMLTVVVALAFILVEYFQEVLSIVLLGAACYWLGYNLFQALGWLQ